MLTIGESGGEYSGLLCAILETEIFSVKNYFKAHFKTYSQNYMLLLLSRFNRVRLCATPYTAAHQAPPSLGFSRQEHWSGLPFPSPVHQSEK